MIASLNPATGELLAEFAEHTAFETDAMLADAVSAQRSWRGRPVSERVGLLNTLAAVLRRDKRDYARLITLEMGKPVTESEAEIEKCAWVCEFYAKKAPYFLADENIVSTAADSRVVFDPLGIVLAIMPWNFPFWQFFRFAAPALAAGNGTLLKHANNVPQCAVAIEQVLTKAGAPKGLSSTLLIEADKVAALIADDRIAAVTLTGSTQVGRIVAAQSGSALKKQVLELGGSDPFIVLADADIAEAAMVAVRARFTNVGQSCVNAKRFIVEEGVADQFVAAFCAGIQKLRLGDPMDRNTNIGPMARANLRDTLHEQVERTLERGGKLKLGGKVVQRPGFFYEPTLIDEVAPEMAAGCEETFGPVAAVLRVKGIEEAVRLANQTEFGLGASIWTRDLECAHRLSHDIEAGAVFVNGMVASDPRLPFGGIKKSGYGRELGSYGIREFVNIKTVWIAPAKEAIR